MGSFEGCGKYWEMNLMHGLEEVIQKVCRKSPCPCNKTRRRLDIRWGSLLAREFKAGWQPLCKTSIPCKAKFMFVRLSVRPRLSVYGNLGLFNEETIMPL